MVMVDGTYQEAAKPQHCQDLVAQLLQTTGRHSVGRPGNVARCNDYGDENLNYFHHDEEIGDDSESK